MSHRIACAHLGKMGRTALFAATMLQASTAIVPENLLVNGSALWLLAVIVGIQSAHAASVEIVLQENDERALEIANTVLANEISEAEQDSRKYSNPPPVIRTAWAKLSESEPPYLFVEIWANSICGNVNCELSGFEKTKKGWRNVFNGSGEKWSVLASSKNGHYDISMVMHGSAFEHDTSIYRWVNGRYWRVSN